MTNKKGAGGAREGAGRKPKILEVKLIEQMDAISVPDKIWEALLYKCQQGDTQAIKLWLSYRFGLPKQQIDITSNGENIAPPIQWLRKNIEIETAKVILDGNHLDSDHLDLDRLDYQDSDRLDFQAVEKIALNNQDLK